MRLSGIVDGTGIIQILNFLNLMAQNCTHIHRSNQRPTLRSVMENNTSGLQIICGVIGPGVQTRYNAKLDRKRVSKTIVWITNFKDCVCEVFCKYQLSRLRIITFPFRTMFCNELHAGGHIDILDADLYEDPNEPFKYVK